LEEESRGRKTRREFERIRRKLGKLLVVVECLGLGLDFLSWVVGVLFLIYSNILTIGDTA